MEPRIHIHELKISSLLLCMTIVQMKPVLIFVLAKTLKSQWCSGSSSNLWSSLEVLHLLVGQCEVCLNVHRDYFNGFYSSTQIIP
jgi:16S rRNA A1518/A1519 N6-dimethyltransferase RsmA/KsgA/DIM1 with predicted DNA glycosylase/AP lyase activity